MDDVINKHQINHIIMFVIPIIKGYFVCRILQDPFQMQLVAYAIPAKNYKTDSKRRKIA